MVNIILIIVQVVLLIMAIVPYSINGLIMLRSFPQMKYDKDMLFLGGLSLFLYGIAPLVILCGNAPIEMMSVLIGAITVAVSRLL